MEKNDSERKHSALHSSRPLVKRFEFNATWIGCGECVDFSSTDAQSLHSRDDSELRDRGECEHYDNQDVAESKRPRPAEQRAIVDQRTGQEYDSAAEAHPMQLQQRAADDKRGHLHGRQG